MGLLMRNLTSKRSGTRRHSDNTAWHDSVTQYSLEIGDMFRDEVCHILPPEVHCTANHYPDHVQCGPRLPITETKFKSIEQPHTLGIRKLTMQTIYRTFYLNVSWFSRVQYRSNSEDRQIVR